MKTLTLATRGSALALAQAEMVRDMLAEKGVEAQISVVKTKGDLDRTSDLREIGGNGLFMREIETELIAGRADIAVHCGKDLPYELAPELIIAGVPKAADSRDCLITKKGNMPASLSDLDQLGIIGTGSARRIRELKAFCPNAQFAAIRGNITTRLRKIEEGVCGAIVLAKAGIDRLGLDLSAFDVRVFEPEEMTPACTQGILALECRRSDMEIRRLLSSLSDTTSRRRFDCERMLFQAMKADCSMAVGIHTALDGDDLTITALFEDQKTSRTGLYRNCNAMCKEICSEIYE